MPITDSLKNLLGSGERTFEYTCRDCETEFTSTEANMAKVTCPECRSTRIR